MNLNKQFLSEIISYLISKGVTLTDVLDTFNEHFNTSDEPNNAIKYEHEKHGEVRKPITDIDLLLCGREIEKQGFNVELEPKYTLTESDKINLESVSLSPETLNKVFDTSKENPLPCRKLKSKSGQMLFDVINGKTVIEHLKENGITYTNFDNRIRKNWSVEKACTTPLTKVVKPYTRAKKTVEKAAPVIVPDNVKVVEESSPKTKMMLVNGKMTELEVSDTEKPTETLETKTETLETESNTEKATKNVTIEPQTESDTDTRVNDTNANSDAKNSESERIEQLTDKTVRDIVTGKNKEKKKAEPKRDYTASDLCLKLGLTTHELREKIEMGELPQPDCGNKWSAKLLKDKNIILFF